MDSDIPQRETNKLQSINSHLSGKGNSEEEEDTYELHLSSMDIIALFTCQPIFPSVRQVQTLVSTSVFVGDD